MSDIYGADRPAPVPQGLELDDLDEEDVKRAVQQELDLALGQDGGTLAAERLAALRYYEGEPFGNEVEGRSQVVMRSVLEAVEWVLPALIRIFTASDRICVVEPPVPSQAPFGPPVPPEVLQAQAEEKGAKATEYLNHIFLRDNPGFLIIHDWFKDALLEKLGWVQYRWDTQRKVETQSYTGLTREEYDELKGTDPDVEVVKERSYLQEPDSFNLDRPVVPLPPPPMPAPMLPGIPGGIPGMGGPSAPGVAPGLMSGTPPPPQGPRLPLSGAAPPASPASSVAAPPSLPPLPPPPVELWDCTLRVTRTNGRVVIENVPPEEILVSRRAKRGDLPFLCHRRRWTKSDLLQQGYDEECLDLVPMDDSMEWNQERVERHREDDDFPPAERRDGNREIWVEESYLQLGLDGSPTTELYRVTTAGKGLVILTKDGEADVECVPEVPFVSICPVPMSHKLVGMSLADLTMDLQLIKSTLIRQMLDNAWLSNWPRIEIGDDAVNENTYDDLLTLRPGGIVRTKRLGGINALMIPYTADKTFPLVEYIDQTQEVRTGVARHNQGINPDDLNKTATGVSLLQQAAAQRVRTFCSNIRPRRRAIAARGHGAGAAAPAAGADHPGNRRLAQGGPERVARGDADHGVGGARYRQPRPGAAASDADRAAAGPDRDAAGRAVGAAGVPAQCLRRAAGAAGECGFQEFLLQRPVASAAAGGGAAAAETARPGNAEGAGSDPGGADEGAGRRAGDAAEGAARGAAAAVEGTDGGAIGAAAPAARVGDREDPGRALDGDGAAEIDPRHRHRALSRGGGRGGEDARDRAEICRRGVQRRRRRGAAGGAERGGWRLMDVLGYLQDVLSGKIAAGGVLSQNNYDPQASFAQNALNPAGLQQAMDIAMGVSGGGLGTRPPAWGGKLNQAISAGDVTVPKAVTDAKYIMPDGKLVGAGDEMHEYIAHLLGYGTRGEDSVAEMLRSTGAARINSANALFDKAAPSIDLYHPPTPQQMSRLDSYLKQRGGAEAAFRDQFGRVERGSDLARLIAGKGLLD